MQIDRKALETLDEPRTQRIFRLVAKQRRAMLRDLAKDEGIGSDEALMELQKLKSAHLIAESASVIPDLNTYFITADGLAAVRNAGG